MQRFSKAILKIDGRTRIDDIQVALQRMPVEIQIQTEQLSSESIQIILSHLLKNPRVKLSFEGNHLQLSLDFQLKLDLFKNILGNEEERGLFFSEQLFQDKKFIKNLNILSNKIKKYRASLAEGVTDEPQAKRRRIEGSGSDKGVTQIVGFSVILINLLSTETLNDDLISVIFKLFSERQINSLERFITSLNLNEVQTPQAKMNSVASKAACPASATMIATSEASQFYSVQNEGHDSKNVGLAKTSSSSPGLFAGENHSMVSSSMLTPNLAKLNKILTPSPVEYSQERQKETVKTIQLDKVYNNPFLSGDQKQGAGRGQASRGGILFKLVSCQLESDWRTVRFFLRRNPGITYEYIDSALTVKCQNNIKIAEIIESHWASPAGLKIVFKNKINTPEEIWENMSIIFAVYSANKYQVPFVLKVFFEENCIDWENSFLEKNNGANINLLPTYRHLSLDICQKLTEQILENSDVSKSLRCVFQEKSSIKILFKHSYSTLALAFESLGKWIMGNDWQCKPVQSSNMSSVLTHHLTRVVPTYFSQGNALPMQQNVPIIPFFPVVGFGQNLPFFGNGQANSQTSMGSAVVDFNRNSAVVQLDPVAQASLNNADKQAQAQINNFDHEKAVSESWDFDGFFATSDEKEKIEEVGDPNFVDSLFAPFSSY